MSLFEIASESTRKLYQDYLMAFSAITRLFSNSDKPFIHYRIVENLFCHCFNAKNLSRSCMAIDAKLGTYGVGIKTFVDNSPYQKVAEFDKKRSEYNTGDVLEDVYRISELRNKRLDLVKNAYDLTDLSYHYVLRHPYSLSIHECPMFFIDLDSIEVNRSANTGFDFSDKYAEYRFNRSKSTLFKSFPRDNPLLEFGVTFIENPEDILLKILDIGIDIPEEEEKEDVLILPLFSTYGGKGVPERSGINQWNAEGRLRDYDEIYIPYNKEFRDISVNFFPPRDVSFDLKLPNNKVISAKICQESGKSIMSNPNKDLGKWLLRDVLKLKKGELVTLDMLEDRGINAVLFTKHKDESYSIDFTYVN